MKDPELELKLKIRAVQHQAQLAGKLFGLALLLTLPALLVNLRGEAFGFLHMPWWAETMRLLGLISFFSALFIYRNGANNRKRYRALSAGRCFATQLEVQDCFTFIKLLPGKDGPLELRNFVVTSAGNWRLADDKADVFTQLVPGSQIQAAVVAGKLTREIIDLEILNPGQALNVKSLWNTVTSKIISEVNITGYQNGQYEVNKLHLFKEVKYYLVLNNQPVQVKKDEFEAVTLAQKYLIPKNMSASVNTPVPEEFICLEAPYA